MKEKLKIIKEELISLTISIKLTIEINILIGKIKQNRIKEEELINSLKNYDKSFIEELINAYKYNDDLVYETLNKTNNIIEAKRKEEFINSVKTNKYKEYLNTLTLIQIYDLKESFTNSAKVIALNSLKLYKEYITYIEILEEKESVLLGVEMVDFIELEERFKTLSTKEIAKYIKTYPDVLLFMETKDVTLAKKLLDAIELTKTSDVEKLENDTLIYKKRKYF